MVRLAGRRGPGQAGAGTDSRGQLLAVLSGNMLLDAIEVSVVLVALPDIAASLGVGIFGVQWLVSGFALGFASLLLLGPRLTAGLGRRRVYLLAMTGFGLASLAGGITGNLVLLVAVRFVKGGCAALTATAGLGIISESFPPGAARRRAVSLYAFLGAIGFTVGLLTAAVLVPVSWHLVFVAPAPVAMVLFVLGRRVLPEDLVQPPILPVPLLRRSRLLGAALVAAVLNSVYQSILLLTVFSLRDSAGWGAGFTAFALLPACVPLVVAVPFASRLVGLHGTEILVFLGSLCALGAAALALLRPPAVPYPTMVLPVLLLIETAFCLSFAALNLQAVGVLPEPERERGLALYQSAVQIGSGLSLPVIALFAAEERARAPLIIITAVAALGVVAAVPSGRPVPARPVTDSALRPPVDPLEERP